MTIRQSRYILAETEREKKVRVTEVQRAEEDPFIRKSEIQQTVNNSTLPVSSRAVNLAIESINSNLDLKADKTELEGLATEDYVDEKIDEKETGITEPELISKSVGSGKWMREGAYGLGAPRLNGYIPQLNISQIPSEMYNGYIFISPAQEEIGSGQYERFMGNIWRSGITQDRYSGILVNETSSVRAFIFNHRGGGEYSELWHDLNTRQDSNGVLHTGKSDPIDTLNTSDMADTIVDNDLLTVTSGAVFRAIKQLTDQIISLEARVRELEDGGA